LSGALGLTRVMEVPPPHADLVSARECDFAEALAALHELVGAPVLVQVLGASSECRASVLTLRGMVERGYELGQTERSPIVFEVAGAMLVMTRDSLAGGCREEYERRSDGVRWRVVGLAFRNGVYVELEEAL
jgi:hypothetical protein